MILPDVNILVYSFMSESPRHREYKAWLTHILHGREAFGLSDIVLSGFLRIVTHPGIFTPYSTIGEALNFLNILRAHPHYVPD